ncbi:MAG TPA: hypothetical protein VMB02_09050 [Candidatus Aquilonibacter sp.]|nr:hypothetical protein [Candidatus Aquilonibacter sp.]
MPLGVRVREVAQLKVYRPLGSIQVATLQLKPGIPVDLGCDRRASLAAAGVRQGECDD